MYCGYVTTIKNIRKHSNADRLQCIEVFGQNVIVDLTYKEGQKVVFFPSDGQLSVEFASENNLLRRKDENGKNVGGYMDPDKRNITAINLRGEKSEGLVLPVECLRKYVDPATLNDGDQISVLNGVEICRKYIPQTKRIPKTSTQSGKKHKKTESNRSESYLYFKEHKDTAQLMYNLNAFKPGDTIYITRKLHGTSGRTMKTTKIIKETGRIRKFFHMKPKITEETTVITGTRRVELTNMDDKSGWYKTNDFRKKWHNIFKDRIPEGCEVFYEIVGYVDENTPIMASVPNDGVKEKEFTKKFGKQTVFSYGCKPGESDMYVYRMTMTTADGTVVEVPWETVEIWCDRMGVKHVPDLEKFIYTTQEDLLQRVKKYTDGIPTDEIGKTHVAEGVVVRIDNRESFTAYKEKVFEFKVIEGIAKDTSDAPDMEEAEEIIKETLGEENG